MGPDRHGKRDGQAGMRSGGLPRLLLLLLLSQPLPPLLPCLCATTVGSLSALLTSTQLPGMASCGGEQGAGGFSLWQLLCMAREVALALTGRTKLGPLKSDSPRLLASWRAVEVSDGPRLLSVAADVHGKRGGVGSDNQDKAQAAHTRLNQAFGQLGENLSCPAYQLPQ